MIMVLMSGTCEKFTQEYYDEDEGEQVSQMSAFTKSINCVMIEIVGGNLEIIKHKHYPLVSSIPGKIVDTNPLISPIDFDVFWEDFAEGKKVKAVLYDYPIEFGREDHGEWFGFAVSLAFENWCVADMNQIHHLSTFSSGFDRRDSARIVESTIFNLRTLLDYVIHNESSIVRTVESRGWN